MKKVIIIYALLLVSASAFAQNGRDSEFRTIFSNNGSGSNGGYGAVSTGYSKIADRDAILIGGHGAWLINQRFGIGISGSGFMTEREYDARLDNRYLFAGGYGGLRLEYILMPNSPVHLSIPMVVGAGGVGYSRANTDFELTSASDSEAFFVVEPGVELEFNIIRLMRISFGASYRFTSNVNIRYQGSPDRIAGVNALEGFTGTVSFKFGKF